MLDSFHVDRFEQPQAFCGWRALIASDAVFVESGRIETGPSTTKATPERYIHTQLMVLIRDSGDWRIRSISWSSNQP